MPWYAGVGSRETPASVCVQMTTLAERLAAEGYWLRSGGADGADIAFEKGAGDRKRIFTFRDRMSTDAFKLAEKYHPAWEHCSSMARKLHARNGYIVFGQDLNTPVDFIVCWTRNGKATGGTGQALRIALDSEIIVFNLFFQDAFDKVIEHCYRLKMKSFDALF